MSRKILLIDDDPGISAAVMIRLQSAGYEIHSASNGKAGIQAAADQQPDVILLDIRMPEMDGFEVCRRLKSDPAVASIPVIFLSANVQDVARQRAAEVGGVAFLSKPFEASTVVATIEDAIEKTSTARPSPKESNTPTQPTNDATPAADTQDKPTVLIADDDQNLLAALGARLENLGFNVVKATNGQLAIDLAKQAAPKLMILDVNMPSGDGFSVIKQMDHLTGLEDIPVIYMSGEEKGHEFTQQSECLGAMTILRKPFEIQELIDAISLVIPCLVMRCNRILYVRSQSSVDGI